jgi:hypothetical protein
MRVAPGRTDHVDAPDRALTSAEEARLLAMRIELKRLLKPVEDALLRRARSTRDARTKDACVCQQRRLWAVYDPSVPAREGGGRGLQLLQWVTAALAGAEPSAAANL